MTTLSSGVVPFHPIASLTTQDGTTLSCNAFDGVEHCSFPLFENVFLFPVAVCYDSAIRSSNAHYCLPKGVRLSFMETYSSNVLTLGDGSKIEFVPTADDSSVRYDPRGSGLFSRVDNTGSTLVIDAVSGANSVFTGGKLVRKVDGYGNVLLTVSYANSSFTATDRLGNTLTASLNSLSLNGGTHVATFTRDSSGRMVKVKYAGSNGDGGWQRQFAHASYGLSRATDPAGEVLNATFYLDGRLRSLGKGIMQGTSFSAEELLTVTYAANRAAVSNFQGRASDLTYNDDYEVETYGDATGRLRAVAPPKVPFSCGFASKAYLRALSEEYQLTVSGSGTSDILGDIFRSYMGPGMLTSGKRYCFSMTADFSSCSLPGQSGVSFSATLRSFSEAIGPTLDFSSGSGTLRTRYGFFTASSGNIKTLRTAFNNVNGTVKIVQLSVVAADSVDFCLPTGGSIGPHFGQNWALKNGGNSFGRRYSSGFEDGYIFPSDASANALLALRGESLFFCDNLHTLRKGDFGYGASFPKLPPSSAVVGCYAQPAFGTPSLTRFRTVSSQLEEAVSSYDGANESVATSLFNGKGDGLGQTGPLGGSEVTRDGFGNPVRTQQTYRDGTLGDREERTYSGQDPRPLTCATSDLTLHYVYSGSTLNVGTLYAEQSDWGHQITAGFEPRGERLTSVVRAGASLSSTYDLNHLSHVSQGTGGIQLLYGLGGLAYAIGGGNCYYETNFRSFAATGARRDAMRGSTGGTRVVYSKYGRPTAVYRLDASNSPTLVASLTYAFTDEAGEAETLSSPLRRIEDSAMGSTTVFTLSEDGLTRTATRNCSADPTQGIQMETAVDGEGRVSHWSVSSSAREHSQSVSLTYLSGTGTPTYASGALTDSGTTYSFSQAMPLDAKGRVQYVSASLGALQVTSTPSYSLNRVTSVSTTVMPASHVPVSSAESLTLDAAGRIAARTVSDGGTKSESYQRDGNGRIIRENNERLGASYFYDYDSSGNLWRVRQGPYSTSGSSASTLHTFGFDASWGALLTSGDGVSTTNVSGYPSSILGKSLSWQSGRLVSYGTNAFSYDAFGNLIGKSGVSGNSTLVRDPSGRLIEEIGSSHSLLFLYGPRGPIGFVVRSGAAAGNYLYRFDAYGNVSAIVNGSGVVARYAYDAFGNGRVYDASWNENASPSFVGNVNPIRYRGGFFDRDSGLYLFGARWYAPFLYRWLSPDGADYLDPSRIDGANPYVYCYNDPVTYVDPEGHMAVWAIGLITGAIIGAVVGGTYGGLTAASEGKMGWEVVGAIGIGALVGGIMGAGAGFGSAVLTGALANVVGIAAWSGASWGIALGASAGTGILGGFTMDTLSQTMYNGKVTDWASVGWSSLQGGIANVVSMLSTSVGGGAGTSWAANLGMNVVMGFPVSGISFAIDMFRYYVWISEEEKERRRRLKAALVWS